MSGMAKRSPHYAQIPPLEPVGDGVSELRIHVGAGWRAYFVRHGSQIIALVAGGSKRTQKADIKRAKVLASLLD